MWSFVLKRYYYNKYHLEKVKTLVCSEVFLSLILMPNTFWYLVGFEVVCMGTVLSREDSRNQKQRVACSETRCISERWIIIHLDMCSISGRSPNFRDCILSEFRDCILSELHNAATVTVRHLCVDTVSVKSITRKIKEKERNDSWKLKTIVNVH